MRGEKLGRMKCPHCKKPIDLSTVSDKEFRSELGRRANAARITRAGGRPPKLQPCPICGKLLSARERRSHRHEENA